MTKCGECVRHDNCWLYDEHKDDSAERSGEWILHGEAPCHANNTIDEADIIKQCDIVDSCEDCPRYGDDCDGDKK